MTDETLTIVLLEPKKRSQNSTVDHKTLRAHKGRLVTTTWLEAGSGSHKNRVQCPSLYQRLTEREREKTKRKNDIYGGRKRKRHFWRFRSRSAVLRGGLEERISTTKTGPKSINFGALSFPVWVPRCLPHQISLELRATLWSPQ